MKKYLIILSALFLSPGGQAEPQGARPPHVYVFVEAGCPCIYTHKDSFGNLLKKYSGKVDFLLVFVGKHDTKTEIDDLLHQLSWKIKYMKDDSRKLVNTFKPHVSSDCVVADEHGKIVYKGAIDDGIKNMGQIKNFYLLEVIHAMLEGKPSPYSNVEGTGCRIM